MKKNKKGKLYLLMILGVIVLIILVVGATYAYYSASAEDNKTIKGSSTEVGIELSVVKISEAATGYLIPLDSDPVSLTTAAKGYNNTGTSFDKTKSCIDRNGYSVCQIYEITVKNTSNASLRLRGGITKLEGANVPNLTCDVMASSASVTTNKNCIGSTSLENDKLFAVNESKTYYIIVYINNLEEKQEDKGGFSGIVEFATDTGKLYSTFN